MRAILWYAYFFNTINIEEAIAKNIPLKTVPHLGLLPCPKWGFSPWWKTLSLSSADSS
jgi:hypothetical protein